MTKELDIIQIKKGILVHPVFTSGKLKGGFSYQVTRKYPNVELACVDICSSTEEQDISGKTLFTLGKSCEVAIASIFCIKQPKQIKEQNCLDLDSFNEGVNNIKNIVNEKTSPLFNFPVYVPYKLGNKINSTEWKIAQKLIFGNISSAVICINPKKK